MKTDWSSVNIVFSFLFLFFLFIFCFGVCLSSKHQRRKKTHAGLLTRAIFIFYRERNLFLSIYCTIHILWQSIIVT